MRSTLLPPRLGIRAAAAALALAIAPAARAQTAAPPGDLPRLYVRRSAEAGDCPDAAQLADLVARHMGRPALDTSPDPSMATIYDVEIFRGVDGYTAIVRASGRGAAGAREISDPGETCAGLAAALPITLAILLDSEAPRPPPPPTPPPIPVPPPSRPAEPPMSRLAVTLGGGGAAGLVAGLGPILGGDLELRVASRLALRLGASFVPPARFDAIEGFETAAIDVSLALGRAGACVFFNPPVDGDVVFSGCASFLAGAAHGSLTGYGAPDERDGLWLGAGVSGVVRVPLAGPVGLVVEGGPTLAILPTKFLIPPTRAVAYDPSQGGGVLVASLRLSIW